MDYEKKYKEALEKARKELQACGSSDCDAARQIFRFFPELKEPDDEMIRKELIDFVKSRIAGFPQCERFITWLEKQGEHANFRNKIQIGDKVTRNEDGVLVNLSQLKRIAKPAEEYNITGIGSKHAQGKLGEMIRNLKPLEETMQKPVSIEMKTPEESLDIDSDTYNKIVDECVYGEQKSAWSEEDERSIRDSIFYLKSAKKYFEKDDDILWDEKWFNLCIEWLESLKDRVLLKQEWNEEDEKKRNLLISILNVNHPNEYFKVNPANTLNMEAMHTKELVDWLKSLKDRIQPQKQEWSDEDSPYYDDICEILINLLHSETANVNKDAVQKDLDWLKSLKERYTWKPSDEHYELEEFAKIVRGNLTGISKSVQELFEAKYLQLTGNKMYGGFKD